MTNGEKKSSGDLVLESKHLVGLFMLLVVIFGVVFTLGYLLGRSQYDTKLRAATGKASDAIPAIAAASSKSKEKSDWDFYHSGEPKTAEDHLQPPASPPVFEKSDAASKSVAAAKPSTKSARQPKALPPMNAPLIPNGAVMLQVAAVQSQGDALALAQALQEKKFPAFVVPPKTDKYYRVQVGPYTDVKAATSARGDLEAKGFKSIVKR